MDSSSDAEGGFAWTDASNSSGSGPKFEMTVEHEDGVDSESGSSYKKKLQKQLFQSEDNTNQQYKKSAKKAKKRKLKEEPLEKTEEKPRAKFVKSEPESDIELPKKKKKKKHGNQLSESLHVSSGTIFGESYLDIKVKEEQSKFPIPNPIRRNKETTSDEFDNISKTDNECSYSDDHKHDKFNMVKNNIKNKISKNTDELKDESNIRIKQDSHDIDRKKIKKKKSKKDKETPANSDSRILIDKFSSDEGCLETMTRERSNKSRSKSGLNYSINSVDLQSVKEQNVNTSEKLPNIKLQPSGDRTSENSIEEDHNALSNIDKHDTPKLSNNECTSQLEENVQRIARISDRIRFEDEENSELETTHERKINLLQVEKFKKAKTLKPLSYKLSRQATITENDELWILKCPQNIDANALTGVTLTIDHRCKTKVGGVTYEGGVDNESNSAALLTSDCGAAVIKLVAVSGVVNLRRRVPKPHFVEDKLMVNNQTDFIPLPETKCRHPLFGSDYKRATKLSESVRERLSGVFNLSDKTESTRKINRKKKKRNLSENELDAIVCTAAEQRIKIEPQATGLEVSQEKKRKRKHSLSERILTKKSKRSKQEHGSAEVWESEKAIEENLFNY